MVVEEEPPFELQDLGRTWWSSNSTTSTIATPPCSDEESLFPSNSSQSQITTTTSDVKAKNGPKHGKIKLKKFIKLASLPFQEFGKNNKYKQFV